MAFILAVQTTKGKARELKQSRQAHERTGGAVEEEEGDPLPTPRIHWNANIPYRGREQSTHTPGEYLIDLDVRVSHRHELNLDLANDALSDEGSKVAEKYVVLVLRNAVVPLGS